MKTTITRPDGTTIELEGTADEIGQVVGPLAPVVSPTPFIVPAGPGITTDPAVYPGTWDGAYEVTCHNGPH